jgi:hypothetical protein
MTGYFCAGEFAVLHATLLPAFAIIAFCYCAAMYKRYRTIPGELALLLPHWLFNHIYCYYCYFVTVIAVRHDPAI